MLTKIERTTITIERDVLARLRLFAENRGKTVSEIIGIAVNKEIAAATKSVSKKWNYPDKIES